MPAPLPLRPIHPTATPPWWPPAPGWWLLAALLLVLLAVLLTWRWRRRLRRRGWARAFDAAMQAAGDPQARLAEASACLRRAARQRDLATAGLEGEAWLAWLDGDDPARPFSRGPARVLVDAAYRPSPDPAAVDAAVPLVRVRYLALRVGRR
jgi:HAMP domain-containing protein